MFHYYSLSVVQTPACAVCSKYIFMVRVTMINHAVRKDHSVCVSVCHTCGPHVDSSCY